jgi:hypothetical protein
MRLKARIVGSLPARTQTHYPLDSLPHTIEEFELEAAKLPQLYITAREKTEKLRPELAREDSFIAPPRDHENP